MTSITELMNMIDESKDQMPEGVYLKIVNQLAEVYKTHSNRVDHRTMARIRQYERRIENLRDENAHLDDEATELTEKLDECKKICESQCDTMTHLHKELESTNRKITVLTKLSKQQSQTIKNYHKTVTPPVNKVNNQIIIRRHKILDKFWHKESGMVFKSARERVIIGKVGKVKQGGTNIDGIVPLEHIDIAICDMYHFTIE